MKMTRLPMILAAAGATLALTAPPAEATVLLLTVRDVTGGTFFTCDNGVGGCNAGFAGAINGNLLTFSGTVGGWMSSLTAANTNSPGAGTAHVDITQLTLTNTTGAARSFEVSVTAFGFTTPPGDPLFFFGNGSGSSTTADVGSIVSTSYFDPANTGALLNPITCNMLDRANESCAEPGMNVFNGGGMYSMTQVLDIVGLGAGEDVNLTGDASVRPVPEPGTLVLAAGALLIAAGVARRRRG